nr:hypothetical protein CFP56_63551 [Quercus suber]
MLSLSVDLSRPSITEIHTSILATSGYIQVRNSLRSDAWGYPGTPASYWMPEYVQNSFLDKPEERISPYNETLLGRPA